jgi:hypothetical protein
LRMASMSISVDLPAPEGPISACAHTHRRRHTSLRSKYHQRRHEQHEQYDRCQGCALCSSRMVRVQGRADSAQYVKDQHAVLKPARCHKRHHMCQHSSCYLCSDAAAQPALCSEAMLGCCVSSSEVSPAPHLTMQRPTHLAGPPCHSRVLCRCNQHGST